MCVLSMKVPIRKKSGNLLYAPRTLYGYFFWARKIKRLLLSYLVYMYIYNSKILIMVYIYIYIYIG